MKWTTEQLADKTSYIKRGVSPKYVEDSGFIILNQKCIRDNRIDYSPSRFTDSQKTYPENKILKKGDILINSTGRGTLGRTAQIKDDLEETQLVDTHITIVRAKDDVDPFFLGQLIRRNEPLIESLGKGSTQQLELSRTDLGEIKLSFPPLPTQRKIASILSAYDDLIENNLKRIKLLEEKAQLHYKELIQEMGYSKTKREEYIKDCLAFYIGGGWGEEDYKEGFTEPAFVIRGTDIPDAKKGEVKSVPFRYHKESNLASRSMQAGDIVFEVSGGSKGQPVGRSILITKKMLQQFGKPVICASFCKMLRPNENVTPEFFYMYLLASHENGVIAQYEKHSASNIVNYGFEEFIGEQKISIPKEAELKAFTEKVKPIFTLISTLGEQNSKLREARDILLPKLMNGQIEV
jgi:type I restriction enzyme S subunit